MGNKIVFITGVSGTGKSEVCRQLQRREISVIGIDETPGLCNWVNKKTKEKFDQKAEFTKEFIDAHDWECDLDKLQEIVASMPRPLVVCGSMDNIVEGLKLSDLSLLLVCSPETFFARIDNRVDNEYGKSEGVKDALLGYYKKYNQDCIDEGAKIIDAEQSVGKVVEDVISYIK